MTIQSTSFLPLKISLHFLNVGVPPVSQDGEERINYWIIQTNTEYENCNWLASKTWSIQATSFFTLEKNSLQLLNLAAPPLSQEGRREKLTELPKLTAYENCNWLAS